VENPVNWVHARTLRRAADIVGGELQLGLRLKVKPSHLSLWLRGFCRPPVDVFLRAVDLVTENELSTLAASVSKPVITLGPAGDER
jgi:hypothetical protein